MNRSSDIDIALHEWCALLGSANVLSGVEVPPRYIHSSLKKSTVRVRAVLLPREKEEIAPIVRIASVHRVSLYPISIGNNWGYGSSTPAIEGCVVVDMSHMAKIVSVDRDLGLVTVEPGVTSGQLQSFLHKENISFISPIIGAGPNASLIGNALERGHGIGAPIDRFNSIMGLEAVLADGSLYRSLPQKEASSYFFKWGVGPYLDGLFGQSNLGIIVQATFALAPRPECAQSFCFIVKKEAQLREVIDTVRDLLFSLGSTFSCVQILNGQKIISRIAAYPSGQDLINGVMSDVFVNKILAQANLSEWVILGALQGEPRMVASGWRVAKERLSPYASKALLFDNDDLHGRIKYGGPKEWLKAGQTQSVFRVAHRFFHSIIGENVLSGVGLPFWRINSQSGEGHLNGSRHQDVTYDIHPECGLVFFSAVLPMQGSAIESFAIQAGKICKTHSIEPIFNFFNFSDRCLGINIPLLFDKSKEESSHQAHACYEGLIKITQDIGGHLQRVPVTYMNYVVNPLEPFWRVVEKIKNTMDSYGIIAPGRYNSSHGDVDQ